ncbi:MAG: HAMP domain-containing protein [Acutalibacteraceae bacterium]
MKKHLIRLFTVSAVVSLIAAFLLSMPLVQRYNLHQTQTQLKSILLILSAQGESLLENPDDFSDRCAGALSGSGLDIRITILGPDGRVVADSGPDSTLGQIHSDRPEVQKARSEGWGFHTRKSESTSILYSYAAYASNGIVYRAAMPLTSVWHSALLLGLYACIGLVAGIVIAFLLSRIWAARSVKPVSDLTTIANRIAAGDLSQRAQPKGELSELSTALNSVTQELSDTSDELRLSNERLRAILQGLDEGVVSIENNQLILLTSRAGNLLGPAPEGATSLPNAAQITVISSRQWMKRLKQATISPKRLRSLPLPLACSNSMPPSLVMRRKARSLWCGM